MDKKQTNIGYILFSGNHTCKPKNFQVAKQLLCLLNQSFNNLKRLSEIKKKTKENCKGGKDEGKNVFKLCSFLF